MRKLLVILERDVGMFSLFNQVLNTLCVLESHSIDRVPIALFGKGAIYFHRQGHEGRRSVWEYYFEPLNREFPEDFILDALGEGAFERLESMRKEQEYQRGLRDFPHDIHLVAPVTEVDRENIAYVKSRPSLSQCAWTDDFLPTIDGKTAPWPDLPAEVYPDLVRRYIRYQPHISRKISDFYDRNLRGFYVIGVHVRGTDGHSAPVRGIDIPFEAYFSEIENRLMQIGRKRCRVYLATDEQAIVSRFEKKFGDDLVTYDAVRMVDGDGIFGKGPTGQAVPAYITKGGFTAVRNGDDVVVEYGLLCRSDFFIHNLSSVSTMARHSVPNAVRV